MNLFVFDIETIPDVEGGRRLLNLHDLSDQEVADAMTSLRKQQSDSDFLRHYLQKVCAISVVFRNHDTLKVWSLGDENSSEKDIISRFFAGIDKYTPNLVSWNGSGFDLPVLHYRALLHKISAPRYWETGDDDSQFRYNNYLNRYHYRHFDVMDILSAYQARATAPLDDIATLLGFPGKVGMDGSKVWQAYQQGHLRDIRNYCETDVLNTYLVYLRFEIIRGNLSLDGYDQECAKLRNYLQTEDKPHFTEFLTEWQ